jgi:transmembrane sensor
MADERHQREFRAHHWILNLARDLPEGIRVEMMSLAMDDAQVRGTRRSVWLAGLAASLALAVGLAGWFTYQYETATTAYVAPASAPRDVRLPDGSVVHLNTRTDLRWSVRSSERRVALLEGEALFEVRHDPANPFVVTVGASEIRVLGTRFNVRRRKEEFVVTVLEGTVEVSQERTFINARPGWKRTLRANQQLVCNDTGLVRDVYAAAGGNAAKWREGILEFENEPLANIVEDLGRYTDRQILVRDPHVAQLRVGGQLNVRSNINASLALLETLAPIVVHESGNTFVLLQRPAPKEKN